MAAQPLAADRFVRRTQLGRDEYRKNFRQIDVETIAAVTSEEADAVTPLMSKIYLRLTNAPGEYWEREGVLRFTGGEGEGRRATAWGRLVTLSGVASATLRKALAWMHEQGVVGYFAGKNGVGIRIFLNRASSSIGRRPAPGQKNLHLVRASNGGARASADDTPFRDSFADSEVLEIDLNPRAPKNGAESTEVVKISPPPQRPEPATFRPECTRTACGTVAPASADELTEALLVRLAPAVRTAAAQAAAREHERTREWLESRGLPKAARVAQREAFNVLRQHGLIGRAIARHDVGVAVGRSGSTEPSKPSPLSPSEIRELAETCVAMLEVHGQAIDVTLSGLNCEAGGVLLAEDALKVRELALTLTSESNKEQHFRTNC
ncbi:MAG TPA: hypothetical protein VF666_08625 [Pyrinomonadaceae bacterium]|jgi:hypothetical protein